MKDDDFVDHLFVANTHDYILCFSTAPCYWLKGTRCRRARRNSRGKPIVNLFPLWKARRSPRPAGQGIRRGPLHLHGHRQGTVKKTPLTDFSNPRKAGIIAVGWTTATT